MATFQKKCVENNELIINYEDKRTGLHQVFGIIGGKSGFRLILNMESLCECYTNIVQNNSELKRPKLCNQVRSLDHFVVQNSGGFLC